MSTRSIEECKELVRLWLAGEHDQVIDELGSEPSEKFLKDFAGPSAEDIEKAKELAQALRDDLLEGESLTRQVLPPTPVKKP